MSARLDSTDYENAYRLGMASIQFTFYAELKWVGIESSYSVALEPVDRQYELLIQMARSLSRAIPRNTRAVCLDNLTRNLTTAIAAYRIQWPLRDDMSWIEEVEVMEEGRHGAEQQVLQQSPMVTPDWIEFRGSLQRFADALPPVLRDLVDLARLIFRECYNCNTESAPVGRTGSSRLTTSAAELHDRLRRLLMALSQRSIEFSRLACDLRDVDEWGVFERLQSLHQNVVSLLKQNQQGNRASEDQSEGRTADGEEVILASQHSSVQRAWRLYNYAVERMPRSIRPGGHTDQQVYTFLQNLISSDTGQQTHLEDFQLEPFNNWSRYLRDARKALCRQKNSSRSGRTGRSIVTREGSE